MPGAKPLVQVACVCENALIEPDGVITIVRVVDTLHLQIPPKPPPDVKLAVSLNFVVMLKSGDVAGEYEIGLVLRQPTGKRREVRKWPVVFNGGEHGVNLRLKFDLAEPELGLYWFDVIWEEEVLTSIPFRLKQAEKSEPQDSPKMKETPSIVPPGSTTH